MDQMIGHTVPGGERAVDLPAHPAILRRPATAIDPDSDLGTTPVTWSLGPLTAAEIDTALASGHALAERLVRGGRILAAALALRGRMMATRTPAGAPFRMENAA